jgi:rhodanese-related sulfurtransferase
VDAQSAFDSIDGMQVVDVRHKHEFEAGRIDGALHIPISELRSRMNEIDPTIPVVTVCRTGDRSARAAQLLNESGYRAENLEGGMVAWEKQRLPFTTPGGTPGRVAPVHPEQKATVATSSDQPDDAVDPSFAQLTNDLIEVSYAFNERFGDEDPDEEQARDFMKEWLMSKGKSEAEAEEFLDSEG